MNILITGGSGFIGRRVTFLLQELQHDITVLTRDTTKISNPSIEKINSLDEIQPNQHIDIIINLAGAPIDKRWSIPYKKQLIDSRVNITQQLIKWISNQEKKPTLLISASAIGYYGEQGTSPLDEYSKAHDGFTHDLCQQWEDAALQAESLGVRTCIMRLGVVLGKHGGALSKLLPAFRYGLGSQLGDGKQRLSWVHLDDVCKAMLFFINHQDLSGIFNITSPISVTNKEFTFILAKTLRRPVLFSTPKKLIKIIFGQMGECLLLKGQHIKPTRLIAAGFQFKYPLLSDALESIIKAS